MYGETFYGRHGTTPAAVKANKIQKWVPLRAMKTFIRKEDGPYYVVSANKASSVTL